MWGFESLLPCQFRRRGNWRAEKGFSGHLAEQGSVAETLKMKQEGIRGSGNGGAVASSFGKLGEYPRRLRQFLHEVRVEMRQVNWPSKQQVWSTTIVVVITVAFFGLYFALTDSIFSRGSVWLLHYFRK